MKKSTRRRGLVLGAALAALVGVLVARALVNGNGLIYPDDPCTERPPLRTYKGVTLQPVAMKAFKLVLRLSKGPVIVAQSYRSCAEQALACRSICGDANGCSGECAKPGTSYHQIGAAVDITQGSLDTPGVIEAFRRAGWCQSQPATDPGHFSYGGCH